MLKVNDDSDENIYHYLDEAIAFIKESIDLNKNILVHCAAGASWSATIVIAYLMKTLNLTYNEAF